MATKSQKLSKLKNSQKMNYSNQNQWIELQLDELEYIIGGGGNEVNTIDLSEPYVPPNPKDYTPGNYINP